MAQLKLKIDPNDEKLGEILAQLKLSQAGSVMAKNKPMETGSSFLDTILEMVTPQSPAEAMPIGVGKIASVARPWVEALQSTSLGQRIMKALQNMPTEVDLLMAPKSSMDYSGAVGHPTIFRGSPAEMSMMDRLTGFLNPRYRSAMAATTGHEGVHLLDPFITQPSGKWQPRRDELARIIYPRLDENTRHILRQYPTYQYFAQNQPRMFESEIFAHGVGDVISGRGNLELSDLIEKELLKYLGVE